MSVGRRLWSVLLAVLAVFANASLDLCACDGASHGASCHGGEVAPSPPAAPAHACCAKAAVTAPVEAPADGPAMRGARCNCPVLALELPPAEVVSASGGPDSGHVLPHADSLSLALELPAPSIVGLERPDGDPPSTSRIGSPRVPLYLELRVLRC
jgi:hypothetical protein